MGGPSNKVNKPRPGYRIVQRQKKSQLKSNPPFRKQERGTFSGGMSKRRRSKGIIKKRKLNVSTNSTPSGKKLRKLLKARLRNEKEANEMQVVLTSTRTRRQHNQAATKPTAPAAKAATKPTTPAAKAATKPKAPAAKAVKGGGEEDEEMKEV